VENLKDLEENAAFSLHSVVKRLFLEKAASFVRPGCATPHYFSALTAGFLQNSFLKVDLP